MSLSVVGASITPKVRYTRHDDRPETLVSMHIGKVQITNTGNAVARGCIANLHSIAGILASDPAAPNPQDLAPLKWAGVETTERAIFPGQTVELGVFEIRDDGVYLHNTSDIEPAKPVLTLPGTYTFNVVVATEDGQLLPATVTITYADHFIEAH